MPEPAIFKATYSGVPVYEMSCKGVAVMRRRSDGWLNATQILKVAGFDKPQRTRVLEREVQKGEHEKVQGGYGKYQGTWIPPNRGMELSKQYNCDELLRPIIDFQAASKSPPPAPKHLASGQPSKSSARTTANTGGMTMNTRSSRRQAQEPAPQPVVASDAETASASGTEDGTMTPSPSEASSSSRTPSPINSAESFHEGEPLVGRKRVPRREADVFTEGLTPQINGRDSRNYADQILEYFISDTNQVPQLLVEPPPDFDPNMAIDDDGHTALHWACAMGRLRVVKLLLTHGADIFKVNNSGQTALMRSVMFSNNYDVRKFPELYELLHRSTLNIDNSNRTVFHHIVDVAMTKGKSHAARYYMETVLARLADYPKELADVINFQDEDGETALTMAARCRSKRLVKILIDHGADPKIINSDGKSAEDYILEDERFRASPPASRPEPTTTNPTNNAPVVHPTPGAGTSYSTGLVHSDRPPVHVSTAAQKASTRCVNDMTMMLDGLAASFDQELREKERDMNQAHALLSNIQAEILESQRTVGHLRTQAEAITHSQQTLFNRESELLAKMGRRHRLGWERWVQDEERREGKIRAAADGQLMLTPATTYRITDEDTTLVADSPSSPDKKGKRKAPTTLFEDNSDLIELYDNIPHDPVALQAECQALRAEVGEFNKKRKIAFQELVTSQAEAGTGGKMVDYRRLIGAGCGGVPPSEVDHVLGMLLETLESEEPTSSSSAWSGWKTSAVS